MNLDFDPFAAAGNHRQDRIAGCHHEHVVLQLRGIFLRRRLLRERPWQHELGLEHVATIHPPVKRCRHPSKRRMAPPHLHVGDDFAGLGLVPAPVQVLSSQAQLDRQISRKIFRVNLAALLTPEP